MEIMWDWSNRKLFTTLTIALTLVSAICFISRGVQDHYDKNFSSERCNIELEATRHQLEVVMEYKDRTDKLLAEAQKHHDTEKDRFKDVIESCFLMTQKASACQNQLNGLQMRCKKTRADCAKIAQELDQLKTFTNSTEMI